MPGALPVLQYFSIALLPGQNATIKVKIHQSRTVLALFKCIIAIDYILSSAAG